MRAHTKLIEVRLSGDGRAMPAEDLDDGGIEGGGVAGEDLGGGGGGEVFGDDVVFYGYRLAGQPAMPVGLAVDLRDSMGNIGVEAGRALMI